MSRIDSIEEERWRSAVFGGTGATGRHVVTQALHAGHGVRILARSPASAEKLGSHDRLRVVSSVGSRSQPTSTRSSPAPTSSSARWAPGRPGRPRCAPTASGRSCPRCAATGCADWSPSALTGAGDSRDGSAYTRLVWAMRGHRMRDKETMEELIVAASGEGSIDATIVRPPALSDRPRTGRYQTGTDLSIGVTAPDRSRAPTWPTSCSARPSPAPTPARPRESKPLRHPGACAAPRPEGPWLPKLNRWRAPP